MDRLVPFGNAEAVIEELGILPTQLTTMERFFFLGTKEFTYTIPTPFPRFLTYLMLKRYFRVTLSLDVT